MNGRTTIKLYKYFKHNLQKLLQNENGATAVEYGLLAAILAVGIIAGADGIGEVVTNMWNDVSTDVAGS